VDDLPFEGWHGRTVRSDVAAGRIVRIDVSALEGEPDVVVVTADDLPGPNVLRLIGDDWPVLAAERVRHVGEAVALVAAPTRERARLAAEAVRVEIEPEPAILSWEEALAQDLSPRADDGTGGLLASCALDHGDVDAALAGAERVFAGEYRTGLHEHIYIEPQGAIALPHEDGSIELVGSLQCPFYVHKALVHTLGDAVTDVRVRQAATGGGFGGKEDYPDVVCAHAAVLALKAGRPIKIVYDRHEDIVATTKRHPSLVRHRTAVDADGRLVAADIEVLMDGGAYVTLSPVVLSRGVLHAVGPYTCPNVRIRGRVLATNTVPNGAFRGFGAPQVQFAAERHMDRIARELGLDPLTLRERNAYRVGDRTPTGQVLESSVSAIECLEEAARRTDFRRRWAELEAARAGRADDGSPWRGIGLTLSWHGSGFTGNGERAMRSPVRLTVAETGELEVRVSSTDFGQGTSIVLAQVVAEAAGVSTDHVTVIDPDTAEVPDSGPTVASRTVMIVGGVLARAGRVMARRVLEYVAREHGLDADALQVEGADVVGPSGAVTPFRAAAAALRAAEGEVVVEERFEPEGEAAFDEETYRGDAYPAYGWACDVVEVSVDPDTLAVTPDRITAVADVGKAIHPVLCAGQVEGGTLQAVAWGYLEELKVADGRYLNDRLSTYIVPTIRDTPDMDTVLVENPAPVGPFGAKGVGELPMDGGAPAVVQAIENATGIAPVEIPATPERLLEDLEAGRTVADAPDPGAGGGGR
jgi:CO/xanthine dehydrogenase Mo-binding subunit